MKLSDTLQTIGRKIRFFIYTDWMSYSPEDEPRIEEWWYHIHIAYIDHGITGYIVTHETSVDNVPQFTGFKLQVYHFPFLNADEQTILYEGYSPTLTSAKLKVRILTWYYTIKQLFK